MKFTGKDDYRDVALASVIVFMVTKNWKTVKKYGTGIDGMIAAPISSMVRMMKDNGDLLYLFDRKVKTKTSGRTVPYAGCTSVQMKIRARKRVPVGRWKARHGVVFLSKRMRDLSVRSDIT